MLRKVLLANGLAMKMSRHTTEKHAHLGKGLMRASPYVYTCIGLSTTVTLRVQGPK